MTIAAIPRRSTPPALQWGWRTRFLNLGINADLDQNTRLLAQVTPRLFMPMAANAAAVELRQYTLSKLRNVASKQLSGSWHESHG